ncbi:MAG: Mor transcription activator family protein [Pseudomonadaceae bacterium]
MKKVRDIERLVRMQEQLPLPKHVREIANIIGYSGAMRLVAELGGRSWEFAKGANLPGQAHVAALADILGDEAAGLMTSRGGGDKIYIPKGDTALRLLRDLEIHRQDAVLDALGDWIIDQDEPARRDNLLRTAYAVEYVRMHASHRLSRLAFQTPITDDVFDLVHTVQVEALGVRAGGKVVRGAARWDHDSGEAVAELELALSRVGQVVAGADFTLPARPAFDFGEPPEAIAQLATQLGGRPTSPPYDEDLDGFAGNYGWETPSSESHPRRLQITTPDIAAEHRDPAEATREQTYSVGLPSDLLLLEVA